MTRNDVIRAWKDPKFRASLSPEQRAALPAMPAGERVVEMDETQLTNVDGGAWSNGLIGTVSGDCNGGTSCWTVLQNMIAWG